MTLAEWLDRYASTFPERPDEGYEFMDGALPRDSDARWGKLFVALHFWDGWIDASNHQWRYYEPIRQHDWPVLAKEIAADLRNDREIANRLVVERFDFRPREQQ